MRRPPGNSPLFRRVSPGRKIFVLLRTKYVVPRHMKPRIPELSIRRGQSILNIVFIVLAGKRKTLIVPFRMDNSVLTAFGTAGVTTVCKKGLKVHKTVD